MFTDRWYALSKETTDTDRVKTLTSIATGYAFYSEFYNADSALYYAQAALQLQQKIMAAGNNTLLTGSWNASRLITLQEVVAGLMHSLGNYPKSLELRFENLKLAQKQSDKLTILWTINNVISDYLSMKDYQHALSYAKTADSILTTADSFIIASAKLIQAIYLWIAIPGKQNRTTKKLIIVLSLILVRASSLPYTMNCMPGLCFQFVGIDANNANFKELNDYSF